MTATDMMDMDMIDIDMMDPRKCQGKNETRHPISPTSSQCIYQDDEMRKEASATVAQLKEKGTSRHQQSNQQLYQEHQQSSNFISNHQQS